MFLGPIHYWLYGKIGHHEDFIRFLTEATFKNGKLTSISNYVRDVPPLETLIDEGNVHGWFQFRITDAERRYTALVLTMTTQEPDYIDLLIREAYAFGTQHSLPERTKPAEAYKAFEDFFVNGMPCDQINLVTESTDHALSWTQTRDLHADAWSSQDGDVSIYYQLCKSVIDGILSESGLRLSMPDSSHYTIHLA